MDIYYFEVVLLSYIVRPNVCKRNTVACVRDLMMCLQLLCHHFIVCICYTTASDYYTRASFTLMPLDTLLERLYFIVH